MKNYKRKSNQMKNLSFHEMFNETEPLDAPISEKEIKRSESEARRAYNNAKTYSHIVSSRIRMKTTHPVFEPKDKAAFEKTLEFPL